MRVAAVFTAILVVHGIWSELQIRELRGDVEQLQRRDESHYIETIAELEHRADKKSDWSGAALKSLTDDVERLQGEVEELEHRRLQSVPETPPPTRRASMEEDPLDEIQKDIDRRKIELRAREAEGRLDDIERRLGR